jgi:glycosyltransferase involved in cell wall biosynthesis
MIGMAQGVDPKVSVVVTCYDLGAYLEEALNSVPVSDQVEVIVVDDGSTDAGTVGVLDRLDKERFTVVRQPNMGLAKARNNGIRMARGSYIIPLDADNRLRPAIIERTIGILDQDPGVDIVYGDAAYFGERNERWTMGPHELSALIERNRIDACAGFRKSLWQRMQGYDEHMPVMGYEDWDFWLRCTVAGAGFRYVKEVLFDYRVRGGSMIATTMANRPQLVAYIFGKPELRFLQGLREAYLACLERERNRPVLTETILLRMLASKIKGRLLGGRSTPAD